MTAYLRVYEYINTLISLLEKPEEYKTCDFAILCDKYPINVGRGSFLARVLYISLINKDKKTMRLYPNKLQELALEHVIITSNARRRISANFQEFFVNGNNTEQQYKEYSFYNYSIERISKTTKEMISKLRAKYDIPEPTIFKGEHQELVIEE